MHMFRAIIFGNYLTKTWFANSYKAKLSKLESHPKISITKPQTVISEILDDEYQLKNSSLYLVS